MKYAQINLSGTYLETAPLARPFLTAGRGPVFRFDAFLARVEHLLQRKNVDTVLIDHRMDFRVGLPGALDAIRHQLERLRGAGKRLVYYARSYDTATLYLASPCSERIIHPLGTVRFQGMARSFVFFKNLVEMNGLEVEIVRRGRYKSAGDIFRLESLDESNREQHQAILEATMRSFKDAVRSGFSKSESEVEELLGGRVLTAEEAVEAKWMTRSATKSNLVEEWRKAKAREESLRKVKIRFGKGTKVAVLVFEGAIVDGKSRRDPALGQSIGSDSFLPEIERLKKNKSIKGVVLRVSSGGGSALASEEIAEGLSELAEKKPLVVSMGGVAGSGGYWIALPGERIFAEPDTITGSIGVISMLFSARETLKRHGITESTVKIGELADLGSPFKSLTERERSVIEEDVDRLYRVFLAKVAEARESSPEAVHRVGEGRIWSGDDAKQAGLVDETGGVDSALEFLRKKLKAKRIAVRFYPIVKYSLVQRFIMRNAAAVDVGMNRILAFLGSLTPATGVFGSFLLESQGKPLAIMEEFAHYR